MSDYAAAYARVTRYSLSTREAFESAIDANPLDAVTHLAYADYLDENGDHDEAAFRRAMGNWMGRYRPGSSPYNPKSRLPGFREGEMPWRSSVHFASLPEGVVLEYGTDHVMGHHPAGLADLSRINSTVGVRDWDTGVAHWRTYRDMEEAFRRAFLRGRRSE